MCWVYSAAPHVAGRERTGVRAGMPSEKPSPLQITNASRSAAAAASVLLRRNVCGLHSLPQPPSANTSTTPNCAPVASDVLPPVSLNAPSSV